MILDLGGTALQPHAVSQEMQAKKAAASFPWATFRPTPLSRLPRTGLETRPTAYAKWLQSCSVFATPWTVVRQAPLSVGFSRQEYWSGFSPGNLPNPGFEPASPTLAGRFFTAEPSGKPFTKEMATLKELSLVGERWREVGWG